MHDTYRLLTFNPYDANAKAGEDDAVGGICKAEKEFLVQMFGINEKGETASIFVEGFSPFFYAMVGDDGRGIASSSDIVSTALCSVSFCGNALVSSSSSSFVLSDSLLLLLLSDAV